MHDICQLNDMKIIGFVNWSSNRDFKFQRRDRKENVKNKQTNKQTNNKFNKQNNSFACITLFFAHFFAVFSRLSYDVKMLDFAFYGERKQATMIEISFLIFYAH